MKLNILLCAVLTTVAASSIQAAIPIVENGKSVYVIYHVGGQQNSAGLVGMVTGNDRELVAGDLSRADRADAEWVACCGRGIKVERKKQR